MLIDVSILVQGNEQVGVGSVLRAIVTQWLQAPPLGWQVVPVYSYDLRQQRLPSGLPLCQFFA